MAQDRMGEFTTQNLGKLYKNENLQDLCLFFSQNMGKSQNPRLYLAIRE